ncbi:MAG: YqaA family protein [Alphaproteobacteria bacterium]
METARHPGVLRGLYDWTMALAEKPWALWALAAVAFIESSVFPIPPDVMLIPMVLSVRRKAWLFAGVCTAASVLGGFAGYLIGLLLFDVVGRPILEFYHYTERFEDFRDAYNAWGAWIVAFFGVTPFPYKVITIASGVTALDPLTFGVASVVSRGLRFFIVAGLLWYFGPPIRSFIERRLGLMATLFFVLLFAGFLIIRFVL